MDAQSSPASAITSQAIPSSLRVIAFLHQTLPAASYITGQIYRINDGKTAS